jgi:predicted DNA-binding transcriptional regulator AlpA
MDKDAFSIPEFCQRHCISRSAFYKARDAGTGPRLMRLGKKVLISKEAAAEWRRAREQAEAATSS